MTTWDVLLLRVRIYLVTMTILTVFSAIVSAAYVLASVHTELTDFGGAMAGMLAWGTSIDVRGWAKRAVATTL